MTAQPKRRRVLKQFVIRELSAVTNPAQEHARAVLLKRFDPGDDDTNDDAKLHRTSPG